MSSGSQIDLTNVTVNNLKGISLTIPHGQWLSVCGLSGSGKSSLAFDTLFAEGQRRYLEALSVKTRQFVRQLDRPEADLITGIPPSVAIRAPKGTPGPRSTLASASEIDPHLRVLFSKISDAFCPNCRQPIQRHTAQSVARWMSELDESQRCVIAWPVNPNQDRDLVIGDAKRDGFVRAIGDNRFVDLAELDLATFSDRLMIVVDRIQIGSTKQDRVNESLESAFFSGNGNAAVLIQNRDGSAIIDGDRYQQHLFSRDLKCLNCDR